MQTIEEEFEQIYLLLHAAMKIGVERQDIDLISELIHGLPNLGPNAETRQGIKRYQDWLQDELWQLETDMTAANHIERVRLENKRSMLEQKVRDADRLVVQIEKVMSDRQDRGLSPFFDHSYLSMMKLANQRHLQDA